MVYIDTSVLVAYYHPEDASETVENFITNEKNPAISRLTELEFFSAIGRKIRKKSISYEDGNKIASLFRSHQEKAYYKQLMITTDHYKVALSWLSQFNMPLRTLDAIHLAIASKNLLRIATSDKQLTRAAKHLGMEVVEF